MDILKVVVELISSVGFPIVACGFMYKLNIDQQKEHLEEVALLREVIEHNTKSLTELKQELIFHWQDRNS